jgi:26S proteasome regulatory subunit N12
LFNDGNDSAANDNVCLVQIFQAKGNVRAESYNFFIDIFLDTIRDEIAACLEKAYEKISMNEAARMLNLPNQTAIKEYGAKVS